MTALEAVSVYLPPVRIPVESLAGPLGLTDMQVKLFRRFHGLKEVGRDPDASLPGMLMKAAAGLDALRGQEHRVRYVLYARTMPVVAPYPVNPLHEVCGALGLEHALAFTVTHQSCAGGLLAIDMAGRLLAADTADGQDGQDGPLALILGGEKAFTRDAQMFPDTSIFGEGASACLVSAFGARDRLLAYACNVRGEFDSATGENDARMQREYRPSLAEVIRRTLDEAGLALDDIRVVLPHNVNVVTWQRMCLLLKFPLDRVLLDNIPANGHVYCADFFLNYKTARERGLLRRGDRYLAAAVGAGGGATFAAMVFEHLPGKPRRGDMTAQETGLDAEFRKRVVDTMITVLARLLERDEPVTEDMRLMEELGLSSTFGLELLLQMEDQLLILIDVERMNPDQTATVGALATFIAGNSRPA